MSVTRVATHTRTHTGGRGSHGGSASQRSPVQRPAVRRSCCCCLLSSCHLFAASLYPVALLPAITYGVHATVWLLPLLQGPLTPTPRPLTHATCRVPRARPPLHSGTRCTLLTPATQPAAQRGATAQARARAQADRRRRRRGHCRRTGTGPATSVTTPVPRRCGSPCCTAWRGSMLPRARPAGARARPVSAVAGVRAVAVSWRGQVGSGSLRLRFPTNATNPHALRRAPSPRSAESHATVPPHAPHTPAGPGAVTAASVPRLRQRFGGPHGSRAESLVPPALFVSRLAAFLRTSAVRLVAPPAAHHPFPTTYRRSIHVRVVALTDDEPPTPAAGTGDSNARSASSGDVDVPLPQLHFNDHGAVRRPRRVVLAWCCVARARVWLTVT